MIGFNIRSYEQQNNFILFKAIKKYLQCGRKMKMKD